MFRNILNTLCNLRLADATERRRHPLAKILEKTGCGRVDAISGYVMNDGCADERCVDLQVHRWV